MKKITILFTLFVLIAALTTSCNKKKLDELEESNKTLQTQLDASVAANAVSGDSINAIKAKLDAAVASNKVSADSINAIKALLNSAVASNAVSADSINAIKALLNSAVASNAASAVTINEMKALLDQAIYPTGPAINMTFTGTRGMDDAPISFTRSFNGLDAGDYSSNYIYDNGNGTYDIYVYRYSNEGYIYFEFNDYNPSDDSFNWYYVYADGTFLQSDNSALYFYLYGDQNYGWGNDGTLNSANYNPTTKVFDVNFTINTVDGSWTTQTGNAATTVISFSGILNQDVYRKAASALPARKGAK